jgi:hypothetical protein
VASYPSLSTHLLSLTIQLSSLYDLVMDHIEDVTSNSSSVIVDVSVATIHVYQTVETCLVCSCLTVDNFSVVMSQYSKKI